MSRSKIFVLLLFFCGAVCFSQKHSLVYQPKNLDSLQKHIAAITLKRNNQFTTSENKKEIKKILDSQKEGLLKDLTDSSYVFDPRINVYLKSVLQEIYKSNSEINPTDFYFLVDTSPIPNAACWGNGIFTVNLGLFDLIENDDELAFILCHEMAHQMLKHNDKSMLSHVQTIHSKDTKKKISQAKNQRYGQRKAVYEVMKTLNYDFLSRSRNAEIQADSLGFVFFSRTKYNKSAAVKSLKKLGTADTLLFASDTRIRKHFNFDSYPFKEAWLAPEETLFDIKEKADDYAWNKDSLKSHPDIPLRIEKLQRLYSGTEGTPMSKGLLSIKKVSAENTIFSAIDRHSIDMALYKILVLKEENQIENTEYNRTVAWILKRTYELKVSHRLGKYISPVNPFSEEKYLNEVRLFLHNTELKNIRKIGLQFCLQHKDEMADDTEFASITTFFSNLNPNN